MPMWWKVKAKKKEKARSFDEAIVRAGSKSNMLNSPTEGSSNFSFDSDAERKVVGMCHPLPRPLISASASMPHDGAGSAGASASTSSVSSSASSEETQVLGNCRHAETMARSRGRIALPNSQKRYQHAAGEKSPLSCSPVREFFERPAESLVSPRREIQAHHFENITSNGSAHNIDINFSPGSTRHGPRSRGNALSTSPVSSRVFSTGPESPLRKQDEMRSPSHPLPLPPSSPTSPASRSLQSKWKKGKLIGRGTFGHVYAGFNRESGQMCAIKEVEVISDDSNSKESLKQLAQEINLLSQLSQTNIVQYYGSELVDFTLSVYLEYVSGGSIHKLLQDYGPFGEPVIRSYAGQILSGLAYLHGRNTIHRDIKGANILVDPYGEIKLADFGMAKHISSYTSIRSFKGSPYWMAPEVIMNTSGYNLSVDIWSLGCTIIEMATAKPPWSQYTGVQAIFKIGNSKDIPEIPNHLSDEGKNFLMLCLQRDPSLRPSAVQLMDHPFVRDQAKIKISNGNIVRDAYPSNPSSSDGCRSTMTTNDFSYNRHPTNAYNRSTSPIQNREYLRKETAVGFFPVSRTPSDLSGLRSNMSLPVSPCSSPLRQFRSSNWSCLPSPPHPMGTSNYGLRNNLSYPLVNSNRYTHNLPEASILNGHAIYGSPRR